MVNTHSFYASSHCKGSPRINVFNLFQGFLLINSLADGGVKMGLNRNQSIRLAAQTMMVSVQQLPCTGNCFVE